MKNLPAKKISGPDFHNTGEFYQASKKGIIPYTSSFRKHRGKEYFSTYFMRPVFL